MRKFKDENGNIITELELQREFLELQQNDPDTYNYTFGNYILNCTDKNGTLTEIGGCNND